MRLNIISTTWITILTLAALLMSGFASSAGMMTSPMSHDMKTYSPPCQTQQMSEHHKMQMEQDSIGSQCEMSKDIVHNCCDTTCTTAAAILLVPDVLLTAETSLALFTSPKSGDVVHTPKSLERPPSA